MPGEEASFVYLEAYYPRTSPAFLLCSVLLFGGLTIGSALALGRAFWPLTLLFALVSYYLVAVAIRQARGILLAIRVTNRAVYHAAWRPSLTRKGLAQGEIPLTAIGGVELVSLRSARAAGPVVALWLSNPEPYRLNRRWWGWARAMSGTGDLAIVCDETDRTAEQVAEAIETAMADSSE